MEDLKDINKELNTLRDTYYNMYSDLPIIDTDIIVTTCIRKTHMDLRPDLKDISFSDPNGRMVLPINVGEPIQILMNYNMILKYTNDRSMTWIGTLAHELTHAIDYFQMAKKEALDIYDPLLRIEQYRIFQMWSEYHARRLGYKFLRCHLIPDNNNLDEQVQDILDRELPYHCKDYFGVFNTNDSNRQIYETFQFLGRLSVWCDLFPNTFNKLFLKVLFGQNDWLYDLFIVLRQSNSLDIAYTRFLEIYLILKENWEML